MVLVIFDDMEFHIVVAGGYERALELKLDISVAGFVPGDYKDVMEFVSRVFERLDFDYIREREPLGKLGYLIAELAREKKFLAITPEDTHYDEPGQGAWQTAPEVAFFVDRGSPYRHVFSVQRVCWGDREHCTNQKHPGSAGRPASYLVLGRGFNTDNIYSIMLNFLPDAEALSGIYWDRWLIGKLLKKAEKLAQDKELHFGIYPSNLEEGSALQLLKKVLVRKGILEIP